MPPFSTLPRRAAFSLLTVLLGGCSSNNIVDGYVCTADFRSGLTVIVKDSVSGAFAASGATLIARDGSYRDSVSVPVSGTSADDAFPLGAAGERSGTYDLTVTKAGYRNWTRPGVVVTRNECHVNTVTLTALLQR